MNRTGWETRVRPLPHAVPGCPVRLVRVVCRCRPAEKPRESPPVQPPGGRRRYNRRVSRRCRRGWRFVGHGGLFLQPLGALARHAGSHGRCPLPLPLPLPTEAEVAGEEEEARAAAEAASTLTPHALLRCELFLFPPNFLRERAGECSCFFVVLTRGGRQVNPLPHLRSTLRNEPKPAPVRGEMPTWVSLVQQAPRLRS